MQDGEVLLRPGELVGGEDIAVFEPEVVLLVEEALALHAGHVKHVQLGQHGGEVALFTHPALRHALTDISGQAQLLRGYAHEVYALAAQERSYERVYRAAELEVAAQSYREVVEAALFAAYSHEVG